MASEEARVLKDKKTIGWVEYHRTSDVPKAKIYRNRKELDEQWREIWLDPCLHKTHRLTDVLIVTSESRHRIKAKICRKCMIIMKYQDRETRKMVDMFPPSDEDGKINFGRGNHLTPRESDDKIIFGTSNLERFRDASLASPVEINAYRDVVRGWLEDKRIKIDTSKVKLSRFH